MIVVTGATGALGRLVIEKLLETVPAEKVVAAVRNPAKAQELAARGVEVREADYDCPETLGTAFAGAEKVLLISSNEIGNRVAQHGAVIDAVRAAGVGLLAYTSILNAETSTLVLAREHQATEAAIRAARLPFVFLRNGFYFENETPRIRGAVEHGALPGAAGNGRFASAARADYAAAAAAVLTGADHENKTYELGGGQAFTLGELATEVGRQAGKPVIYKNLPEGEYAALLESFGLPKPVAVAVADADTGAARGELSTTSPQLRELIGRPTVTLGEAVAAALA